jgi:hypothetical protein
MYESNKTKLMMVVDRDYDAAMKALRVRHKLYTTQESPTCRGASFDGVEVKRIAEDILKLQGQDVAQMVRQERFLENGSKLFRALFRTAKFIPTESGKGMADYLEKLPAYASFMLKWAKATLISLKMKPTDEELAKFGDLCRW